MDIVTGKLDVCEAATKLPDLPSDFEVGVGEVLTEDPELAFQATEHQKVPKKGTFLYNRKSGNFDMRIIAKKTLVDYWKKVPATKSELHAWHAETKAADWATPADVKAKYGNASILKNGRVVFNICGNKHRLVVWINYDFHTIYIRFLGTHVEYDKIDATTI